MRGIVAIIGRPNVGKSTFFNRLVGGFGAIVDDIAGVTRDRNYGTSEWNGKNFTVIDTGGYITESNDVFDAAIREQVKLAIDECDVILFMVDGREGVMPFDYGVADIVRKSNKKNVILVVNKIDTGAHMGLVSEFYELGFDSVMPIAGNSGSGTGDLMDEVVKMLPEDTEVFDPNIPKIAFVGRPNVGKSSLVNALTGNVTNIVTPVAGTTRDSKLTLYNNFNFNFYLVDTAGLRKKAKEKDNIEFYSTLRSVKAIDDCDLAFVMIDATTGLEAQDLKIIDLVIKRKKGLVILVNKWDLVQGEANADSNIRNHIMERLVPLTNIPIILISATEKTRIFKALEVAKKVLDNRETRIPTRKLNDELLPLLQKTPPPSHRGHLIRIKFISQVDGRCPTFAFYTNYPDSITTNYKRFIENQIRALYGFDGLPITIVMRENT